MTDVLGRITKLEETVESLTKAIGAFRIEIETLKTRMVAVEITPCASESHSHLGVDQELERLNDEIQNVKDRVMGADEGHHSSFQGELLHLKNKIIVLDVIAKEALVVAKNIEQQRIFACRQKSEV